MYSELRNSGISVVGDMPWGTHFCHFYETKQDLLDTLVPYFKAGLESKEFCLWVVSNAELITVEEAKEALEQAVPDLDRHLSDENIEILDGLDWYLEDNVFNLERVTSAWDAKLKRALALGYDGLRVSGDTFWLGETEWKEFCAYEKQLNDSIADRPMTVLCTYPLAKSGAAEILDVVQTHQFAIARRQGEWKVIQSPELTQAKAEIKRLNQELQRAKERTPTQPLLLSYGAAVLSVTAALTIARLLGIHLAGAPVSLLLCAVMFSAWYGGLTPGLLALALSLLGFDYYFLAPIYSLTVEMKEIPRFLLFTLAGFFVALLTAAQRNAAGSLRHARDVLDGTVQELKRTNESLHAKNAERARAQEKLEATSEQLRALSTRLQSAREVEGARIARELHDELGSALTSLKFDLALVRREAASSTSDADSSRLRAQLDTMMQAIDQTVDTVRRISSELRPSVLDDIGLVAAIRWQAKQFEAQAGIVCQCDVLLEDVELDQQQSTAIFRVFQEALTNVRRHARATRVNISIDKDSDVLELTVRDNGQGITAEAQSSRQALGLLGMRERVHLIGGTIRITGVEREGTAITVRVPIRSQ